MRNNVICLDVEFSDMANDYVTKVLKINLKEFKYKIYVVPKGDLCNWGGMGYVGCVDDCRAWVNGDLVEVSCYPTHESRQRALFQEALLHCWALSKR
jgi:hypothetical protein